MTKYGPLLDCERGQILSRLPTGMSIKAIFIDIGSSRDALSRFLKHPAFLSQKNGRRETEK